MSGPKRYALHHGGFDASHLRWRQKGKTGWKQAGPGFCAADFAWFEFQRCIHPGILNDDIVSWFFRYLQEQPQNAQHERSAKDICLGSGRQGGFLSTMFQGFLAESRIVCLWRIRTQNKAWSFTYFHVSKFNQILLTSWLWTQTCLLEACGWNLCMSAKSGSTFVGPSFLCVILIPGKALSRCDFPPWGWPFPHWPCRCFPWCLLLPLRAVVMILAAPQMTWRRPMCCFRWARSTTWAQMLWRVMMPSHLKRRLRKKGMTYDSSPFGGSFDTTQPTAAGHPIPFQQQPPTLLLGRRWYGRNHAQKPGAGHLSGSPLLTFFCFLF